MPESILRAFSKRHGGERPKLDEVLDAIQEISQRIEEKCIVVVDALDESNMKGATEASEFTKLLLTLKRTSWKVLAFSRSNMQNFMLSDIFKRDSYKYAISPQDTSADIELFVVDAIQNSHVEEIIGDDTILKDHVVDMLSSKAQGM